MDLQRTSSVLVTGATGFVGRHLCSHLVGSGYQVRGSFRTIAPQKGFPENMSWVRIDDIGPNTDWVEPLREIDVVVHLAALAHQLGSEGENRQDEFMRVNAKGTQRLAEVAGASPHVQRLVFLSSIGAVRSFSNNRVTESTECEPDTDYGKSKRAAELAIQQVLSDSKLEWCIIRPVLVYGPGNPGNMARLQKLVELRLPLPFARIDNSRSFVYVGNLVRAIERCLWHPGANRRLFIVSDGADVSTPSLISKIAQNLGARPLLLPLPTWMLKGMGRAGDIIGNISGKPLPIDSYSVERLLGSLAVDSTAIRRALDWTPPYSLDDGIAYTLEPENT